MFRYITHLLLPVLLFLPVTSWAQFELPGTDIWLLNMTGSEVTSVEPIVQRAGYDNQPSFSHNNQWLHYTRGETANDGLGYTDIWRVNLNNGQSSQVTATSTSEFSPLPLPGAPGLSMVRVQQDGRQELWAIFPDSEQPERRIVSAEPVGYHAWLSADSLALFVLGDPELGEPNRLELWQPSSDTGMQITNDIGRGLQVSNRGELFYVQNPSQITRMHLNKTPVSVIGLHENGQDFALGSDGVFWHGSGSKIYRYTSGDNGWQLIIDLQLHGLNGITRVAINPAGDRLAVVVSE